MAARSPPLRWMARQDLGSSRDFECSLPGAAGPVRMFVARIYLRLLRCHAGWEGLLGKELVLLLWWMGRVARK